MTRPTQQQKCEQFARLHQSKAGFIIPNPWDSGSARLLQGLGFKALATTSAGFAFTAAKTDGAVSLDEKLAHCRQLVAATDVPINADFENGFANSTQGVYDNVLRVAATGVAGCSIEDYDRDTNKLYPVNQAVERIQAAVEAVKSLDIPFQLTARAENLIRGVNDLDDTVKRLRAYEQAGANVLYAPGIGSLDDLRSVTSELKQPFNVLSVFIPTATANDLIQAGATRISLGGALAWACIKPLLDAGREMLEQGSFNWTAQMAKGREIKELLSNNDNINGKN